MNYKMHLGFRKVRMCKNVDLNKEMGFSLCPLIADKAVACQGGLFLAVRELCSILILGIRYVIHGVCTYISELEDVDFRCFYIKISLLSLVIIEFF